MNQQYPREHRLIQLQTSANYYQLCTCRDDNSPEQRPLELLHQSGSRATAKHVTNCHSVYSAQRLLCSVSPPVLSQPKFTLQSSFLSLDYCISLTKYLLRFPGGQAQHVRAGGLLAFRGKLFKFVQHHKKYPHRNRG